MIENIEGQGVSFIDYRFIPLLRDSQELGHNEDNVEF